MRTLWKNHLRAYRTETHGAGTQALADLVGEHARIWVDTGFVKVPEDEWMRLPLRDDWQSRVSEKVKVCLLGIKDREIIDKDFDELYEQDRLEWIKEATPFSFPVFIVRKACRIAKQKAA